MGSFLHKLKEWSNRLNWTRRKTDALLWTVCLPLVAVLLLLHFQYSDPQFRMRIRDQSFDQLQKLYPAAYSDAIPVRVVAVDDPSLAAIGQWPWPRTVLAQIVDKLGEMGASVVVMDLLLAEADRTSPEQVKQFWPDDPRLNAVLSEYPSHDAMLAATMARGRVVAGVVADNTFPPKPLSRSKSPVRSDGGDARNWINDWVGGVGYLPILAQPTVGTGVVTVVPDYDGILRSMPLLSSLGGTLYPGLGLEAVRVYLGTDTLTAKVVEPANASLTDPAGIAGISVGRTAFFPTTADSKVWLKARPHAPARYVSAIDVLTERVEPERIKDHIVIIGSTSVGLGDVVRTPLGGVVPGLEGHLQLIEQLLTREYLLRPAWENTFFTLLIVCYTVAGALMLAYLRPAWSVLLIGTGVLGVFAFSSWLFQQKYLLLDPVYPALSLVCLFIAMAVPRYLRTESEQRWIKTAFSRYVSPNRVKFLQEHPETLNLGGEYRECSFVMTDLAGFTSLMEKYEPAMLSSLLNDYLNGMIETAFAHDGTLDRIVGDAVAVMFSAPVPQSDHAQRAVACALAMDQFANTFCQRQQALGIPFGKTRIGVNTGPVMVGNFGGKVMLDYRALGDAINTAARLETLNNHLGTRVSVSESTVQQCPGFRGRPAGDVILKGKTKPVRVFEPLAENADQSERVARYHEAFAAMEATSASAAPLFRALQKDYPDDALVQFHVQRIDKGETGGLIVMQKK
jgi:adenylate cyclase